MTTSTVTTTSWAKDDEPSGPTLADLYALHRLSLTRLATALLGDQGNAEDAVQDAFVRLWHSHRGRTDMLENPLSYLRTAVVNNARSIMRRHKTAREHPPFFLPPAESAEEEALPRVHREVLEAVKQLPERQREVLVLRYWADMSEADIAATTGISRGTVKSTSSRGLRSVARTLRERGQL
ncbi:RNA polymerase sigma-70 factor (sigma-E family) [Catenulispora sp. MAP5-51]|uniref:SigE family RNA polymerase sigma factor n=1 Tax=Catenulispora sp. MAP5-51 TaxID=3156298 RepID=UPI003516B568